MFAIFLLMLVASDLSLAGGFPTPEENYAYEFLETQDGKFVDNFYERTTVLEVNKEKGEVKLQLETLGKVSEPDETRFETLSLGEFLPDAETIKSTEECQNGKRTVTSNYTSTPEKLTILKNSVKACKVSLSKSFSEALLEAESYDVWLTNEFPFQVVKTLTVFKDGRKIESNLIEVNLKKEKL